MLRLKYLDFYNQDIYEFQTSIIQLYIDIFSSKFT